jgi:hypothetical protein
MFLLRYDKLTAYFRKLLLHSLYSMADIPTPLGVRWCWTVSWYSKLSDIFSVTYLGLKVAQLVKALCYKQEGHGFGSQWHHWNFSLTQSFRLHCGPGVDSSSNRNEYQEYFLGGKGDWCIGLTTLPPSCADCHEIWVPQSPGTLRACPGL